MSLAVERLLANPYGFFEPDGSFVVTDILTPRPWINVLANEHYGLVLSQAGGGFSWAGNCQIFRLNRWEQDLVEDRYGRFLYVQDLEAPADLWSAAFQPTRRKAEKDEVRHRLGSTTYIRRFRDLETRKTVFVTAEDCAEVWLIEIENRADSPRRLRLATYLEWHLGGIGDWHREFHRLFVECRVLSNTLVAWKHPGLKERVRDRLEAPTYAFVSWNASEHIQWVTDKQRWLGTCGSAESPAWLLAGRGPEAGDLPPSRWDDPVAAGIVDIEVGPGETRMLTVVIGAAPSAEEGESLGKKYGPVEAQRELLRITQTWINRCEEGAVRISEPAADLMNRTWLPYQAIAGRLWARCAYYQQGGAYGYRDQLQDSLVYLDSRPEKTLEQLGRHAEAMYEDGAVRHWWHPGTDVFVESHHSDTCLWLAYGVLEYLEATADYDALARPYSFLSRESQKTTDTGSLWEHCRRGIDHCLSRFSPRGLPLIGSGDWNDGLSHAGISGKGESVWLAMFLYDILNRWRPHLTHIGEIGPAAEFEIHCHELASAVNRFGWDGEWYIEGTRDDGLPIGASECREGRIYLNPQTWAVISGIAPADRSAKALHGVRKHLLTPYGALLLAPAYSQVDPYIGYITRYAPGLRENGGVYSHASAWAVLAFAKSGDLKTARSLYRSMMPPLRAQADANLYAAEPFVMPGNVDGPDSPYAGRAGWTWYTGSAAWMRRIAKHLRSEPAL